MVDPKVRSDLSPFLIHLTRKTDSGVALENLASMLGDQRIKAQSVQNLFMHEPRRLGFSDLLTKKFRSVSFTEIPLEQIRVVTDPSIARDVKLEPCGLVFASDFVRRQGAGRVNYVDARSDAGVRDMMLADFRKAFRTIKFYRDFARKHHDADARIANYVRTDTVTVKRDFQWEREWRLVGDLTFQFTDLIAIICPQPDRLRRIAKKSMNSTDLAMLDATLHIDADWTLSDMVQEMSIRQWATAIEQGALF